VNRIIVGLKPTIGIFDVLNNNGMSKSQKRQSQNEIYMKLRLDRIEVRELSYACEFLNMYTVCVLPIHEHFHCWLI
jgi:hypothetical protein